MSLWCSASSPPRARSPSTMTYTNKFSFVHILIWQCKTHDPSTKWICKCLWHAKSWTKITSFESEKWAFPLGDCSVLPNMVIRAVNECSDLRAGFVNNISSLWHHNFLISFVCVMTSVLYENGCILSNLWSTVHVTIQRHKIAHIGSVQNWFRTS